MSAEGWFGLVVLVLQAVIFGAIFRKAGYSGWLGLLMAVPLVNLGLLVWFAAATWPPEMGYVTQARTTGVDAAWELRMALRKAATHEKRGEYAEAIKQFEAVAEQAGDWHPNGQLVRERIRQLRAKMQTDPI